MFTGLVEAVGMVRELSPRQGGCRLTVAEPRLAQDARLGESVAVNGACLTVIAKNPEDMAFDVGPETLARTNLGRLHNGDGVNLERSLRVGDRLGGHWVQGHVDGVANIARRERQNDWEFVWFDCPTTVTALMVPKGSIAVDGISLTLVEVTKAGFSVMLIPHTLANTTLGRKGVGAEVNIETDILAKHVQKLMAWQGS